MKSKTITLTQSFRSLLISVWHWLREAIFPRYCLGCGSWGEWCCLVCTASLTYPRQLRCPECETLSPLGEFCVACAPSHNLKGLWAAQPYGNPIIRALIKAFKFNGVTEIGDWLVNLMQGLMRAFNLPPAWHSVAKEKWCLTPVPLANKRLRGRNFNQAEILAIKLANNLSLPFALTLQRQRSTKPQSAIDNDWERSKNVNGVFAALPNAEIKNRVFILVDDVYTSGATMEECARTLKAAGALEVWGLVAAKG